MNPSLTRLLALSFSFALVGMSLARAESEEAPASKECVDIGYGIYAKNEGDCYKSASQKKPSKDGSFHGVREALCRDSVGEKGSKISVFCSPENVKSFETCQKHPLPQVDVSKFEKCMYSAKKPEVVQAVEQAWMNKDCYVLGFGSCSKGVQVENGCDFSNTVSAKFFYTPDCKIESKANALQCWVGKPEVLLAEKGSCMPGKLVRAKGPNPVCKKESDTKELGSIVFFSDSRCITRADDKVVKGGGFGTAVPDPKVVEKRGNKEFTPPAGGFGSAPMPSKKDSGKGN